METAVFGGGCFWCTEAVFAKLKGVTAVTSGYAGGSQDNPSYSDMTTGETGHAEVIKIDFDPSIISYEQLLSVFFAVHDPTTKDRQGPDTGSQYRSIILTTSRDQKKQAEEMKAKMAQKFNDSIVTQIEKLDKFYTAEDYHQKYFEKNPSDIYCNINAAPKIEKIRHLFPDLFES